MMLKFQKLLFLAGFCLCGYFPGAYSAAGDKKSTRASTFFPRGSGAILNMKGEELEKTLSGD